MHTILSGYPFYVAVISNAFLIFVSKFYIKIFNELKTDGTNPLVQCNHLNLFVMPEYLLHCGFNLFLLFEGHFITIAINLPLIAYHITKYRNRPDMSKFELYDPTTIMNADKLYRHECETWIKLAFYLCSFVYYVHETILALIAF